MHSGTPLPEVPLTHQLLFCLDEAAFRARTPCKLRQAWRPRTMANPIHLPNCERCVCFSFSFVCHHSLLNMSKACENHNTTQNSCQNRSALVFWLDMVLLEKRGEKCCLIPMQLDSSQLGNEMWKKVRKREEKKIEEEWN